MSKQKRGRKHRSPQQRPARPARAPRPMASRDGQTRVWPEGSSPLAGSVDMTSKVLENAPPEQLAELLLPYLWASLVDGAIPSNVCVDACMTLRHAYGQLGIRAEPQPVSLVIKEPGGARTRHGLLEPEWHASPQPGQEATYNGHCVLILPESERIVDATVEQFDPVRKVGLGPLVGKTQAVLHGGERSLMEPHAQIMLQRGQLLLSYTVPSPKSLSTLLEHPVVAAHADDYRRTGTNVAALAVVALRTDGVRERALRSPYPRLHALLHAVGDAPYDSDPAGDVRFNLPDGNGERRPLRLDELPLPPDTPPAWPRR